MVTASSSALVPLSASMRLAIPNLSPPDAVRSASGRSGWRSGAVPPWLDCDVDEDGELVCPDHFEFGTLSGREYKDYAFPEPTGGRYVYRQFDTGDIFILETPSKGKLAEATRVPRKTKAWTAISSAIYARKAGKKQAALNAFAQIAAASAAVLSASAKPSRGESKAPGGLAVKEDEVVVETTPAPESSGFPWIPVAVAGTVAVAVFAIFGGGKS
jgi:hypothetical protein